MTITGRCLCGAIRWESSAPPIVTRVCWCRECQYLGAGSGTVNACFRTASVHRDGPDQRLSKCRGQWQPNAPAILPIVRDAALQRGRGAASSDLRPCWHFRRSESRQSCNDDLDVVCAPLGLHRRRVAASGEATTTSGVMSDGNHVTSAQTDLGFTFRSTAKGAVHISRDGREVVILRAKAASQFLAKAEGASMDAVQQLCARVTGNYKRGNETTAASVRKAKGRSA